MVIRLLLFLLYTISSCIAIVLVADQNNYAALISGYELTIIKFSAEWCHFSQMLSPIFEEASQKIQNLTSSGRAALITIDCDANRDLCTKENIRKYPTLKVSRYGRVLKQEYRDQRTVEAFVTFVHANLKDPVITINGGQLSMEQVLKNISDKRPTVVGLFNLIDNPETHMKVFRKVAAVEQDLCSFYLIYNVSIDDERLAFRDPALGKISAITILRGADFKAIQTWIVKQCTVLVRELTFANAEQITEEGLPLMLLFYDPQNKSIANRFVEFITAHLADKRTLVNFVIADGNQFSHPLLHLGKTVKDLPLICIDSFAHMYLFPQSVETAISDPKYLADFIADLISGKLHREYHFGPDPTTTIPITGDRKPHQHNVKLSTPPESVFRRLAPSRMRYTILHDEF